VSSGRAADAQEGREDFLIVRTSPLPPGSLMVESSGFRVQGSGFRVQARAAAQTKLGFGRDRKDHFIRFILRFQT